MEFMKYMSGRENKRTTLAVIVSSMLLERPGVGIIAFVRSPRQVDHSASLLAETARMLKERFHFEAFALRKESLQIQFSEDDVRTFSVYAVGEGNGLRGIGGNVIIMEEVSEIPLKVRLEVIVPMTVVEGTLLLAYVGDVPVDIRTALAKLQNHPSHTL